MINLSSPGWHENMYYPGTHWLYYDKHGNYRAKIEFNKWTNGHFRWSVMYFSMYRNDISGYEETLEDAQKMAEKIMNGQPYQQKLF